MGHPARLRPHESAASNLRLESGDEATRRWPSAVCLPGLCSPGRLPTPGTPAVLVASPQDAFSLEDDPHLLSAPMGPLWLQLGAPLAQCAQSRQVWPTVSTVHSASSRPIMEPQGQAWQGARGAESEATRVCKVCVVRARLSLVAYVVEAASGRAHGPSSVLGSGGLPASCPASPQALSRRPQCSLHAPSPVQEVSPRELAHSRASRAGRPGLPAPERPARSSVGGTTGPLAGVGVHLAGPRSSALPAASLDEALGPRGRQDSSEQLWGPCRLVTRAPDVLG